MATREKLTNSLTLADRFSRELREKGFRFAIYVFGRSPRFVAYYFQFFSN